MQHINKVRLMGRISNTPEIKELDNTRFITFTIATTSKYYCSVEKKQKSITDFHNIKCYGQVAAFVNKAVQRGDKIFIQGAIRKIIKQDADGNLCDETSVVASSIDLLGNTKKRDERVIYWDNDHKYYVCYSEAESLQFEEDVHAGMRQGWKFKVEMYKEKRDDINEVLRDPFQLGF